MLIFSDIELEFNSKELDTLLYPFLEIQEDQKDVKFYAYTEMIQLSEDKDGIQKKNYKNKKFEVYAFITLEGKWFDYNREKLTKEQWYEFVNSYYKSAPVDTWLSIIKCKF